MACFVELGGVGRAGGAPVRFHGDKRSCIRHLRRSMCRPRQLPDFGCCRSRFSSRAISYERGIRPSSIDTCARCAFAKLGIASRRKLLNLLLDHDALDASSARRRDA
ncbi:hypothetical protein HT746_00665 [Burkholderia pyrrocinia]|uniref:hypothetical protein n=1 Tax=Burkholderia pyrrocinia TaxID=60550 RepID=UPI001576C101|nr:hypothetical protein [Burkholderia pyrrocinia]NTX25677.1 hypothetical protein [Burkholderia pyrrocinia]